MLRCGRGFGKTRTGAGWVHKRAMEMPGRWIAICGRTPADVRDYQIEGPGGILRNTPAHERPKWEPSKRRLTWPTGSWGTVYAGDEPEQARGFSGDSAWLDELAKWREPEEFWDNLQFGMREASSDRPRRLITTTPRPLPIIKKIEAMPTTMTYVGSSYENRSNLDATWYAETLAPYEGTRKGRQEIHAEILDDIEGALWTRAIIERNRVKPSQVPDMLRIVVAVDPSGSSGDDADREKNNDIGIVGVGKGVDGNCYVFQDWTCNLSPKGWGRRAVELYTHLDGDAIVAEINYGGAMVEAVIRGVEPNVKYVQVHASRGKVQRAEPVSALSELNKVKFVGGFAELEDELCYFTPDGYLGDSSPNRADAFVWGVTELMLTKRHYGLSAENVGTAPGR